MEENSENCQREKRLIGEMRLAGMVAGNDLNNLHSQQYFLDGPGGTRKTFLYNTLI